MNSSLIGRIAWKEFRQQRSLLLSIAGVSILSQLCVVLVAVTTGERVPIEGLFVIGLGMPALYALGCGALLFAGEDEAGTIDFLRAIPVSNRELLIGKLAFAVASTFLLMPVLWLATVAITRGALPDPADHVRIWLFCLAGWFEMLAWSVLCSLLVRRVLWATLVAGSTATLVATFWFFVTGGQFLQADSAHMRSLPGHAATALAVSSAIIYAGRRWLHALPTTARRARQASANERRVDRADAPLQSILTAGKRLIWQERAQSTVVRRLLFAAAIVLGAVLTFAVNSETNGWHPVLILLPLLAAVMGVCVFAGDQRQMGFRFLCEHGVGPRMVWLTRHLIWSGWLAIAMLTILVVIALQRQATVQWSILMVGFAIVFYSIGQVCSLFLRSTLLAMVATAAGCLMAGLWYTLNDHLWPTFLWTVWTIPVLLLFATWLRMPDWITERTTWRARLWAIGSLAIPGLVMLTALGTYRALEIPRIPLPYDRTEIERDPTKLELATANQYGEAQRLFEQAATAEAPSAQQLRDDAMGALISASQQPVCRLSGDRGLITPGKLDFASLSLRVTDLAATLEQQGAFDDALELYWALLRMANHLYSQPGLYWHLQAVAVEKSVLERLPTWAARCGQSSEEILDVLGELEAQLSRGQPDWEMAIGGDYCLLRRIVELDPQTLVHTMGPKAVNVRYVAWLAGWEQVRTRRLLDSLAATELSQIRTQWDILANGGVFELEPWRPRDLRNHHWVATTPLVRMIGRSQPMLTYLDVLEIEMRRRAARIQLALVAWQIDHHKLPPSLDDLVTYGLESVPSDPFCGRPFYYAKKGSHVLNETTKVYEPAGPSLWCSGRMLGFTVAESDNEQEFYKQFFHSGLALASELEFWRYGVRYPIPLVDTDAAEPNP